MNIEEMKQVLEAIRDRNYVYACDILHEAIEQAEKQSEFIKHIVANTYDWSEWVCPDPERYLMKCCDCGLVHEAEFKVVRYKSETEREDCDPVDDPSVQAVFRMRRSEQWSPEDTAYRPGGLAQECNNCGGTGDVSGEYPGAACPECSGKGVIEQAEKQEPVAVKRMMEWVDYLKRKSDYGQHLQIPSGMSAGVCWDLARELEQFVNTSPPPRQPLTDEEIAELWLDIQVNTPASGVHEEGLQPWRFARAIEAAHGIKEKNT